MPTNKQRREAERRHLERQLQTRRVREARRRKMTLIISVSMTIVLIAAIVITVVLLSGGSNKKKNQAGNQSKPTATNTTTTSPSPSTSPSPVKLGKPVACATPPKKIKNDTVSSRGVTVKNATDLKTAPALTAHPSAPPKALECQDLVVGKGPKATPISTVSVQYLGALYANGTKFDSSWDRGGKPISFSLQRVVPGFTEGIGGVGKVAPMRVGGRRVIIMPSQLGYGATAQQNIPANSALVFVVDLTKTSTPGASSSTASAPNPPSSSPAASSTG